MELKKPNKALGFYSEGSSGDEESFIEGIEGGMSGLFTGIMSLVSHEEANNVFDEMKQKVNEFGPDMAENELEAMICLWELEDSSLLICAEFGSSNELCSLMKESLSKPNDAVEFDEVALTLEDLEASKIAISDNLKKVLNTLYNS